MLAEHPLHQGNSPRDWQVSDAKEDDASVRQLVANDKLAEVLIVGDERSPLAVSDRQDLLVLQSLRVVNADHRNVVTNRPEESGQTKRQAFV